MVSNIFYLYPYLGKIPIMTNIFQMGWNHQLVKLCKTFISSKDRLIFVKGLLLWMINSSSWNCWWMVILNLYSRKLAKVLNKTPPFLFDPSMNPRLKGWLWNVFPFFRNTRNNPWDWYTVYHSHNLFFCLYLLIESNYVTFILTQVWCW